MIAVIAVNDDVAAAARELVIDEVPQRCELRPPRGRVIDTQAEVPDAWEGGI